MVLGISDPEFKILRIQIVRICRNKNFHGFGTAPGQALILRVAQPLEVLSWENLGGGTGGKAIFKLASFILGSFGSDFLGSCLYLGRARPLKI